MTFIGQMRDGVVVFPGPVAIPDGAEVRVEVPSPSTLPNPTHFDLFRDIIGKAVGLPDDFAAQHDHYIHGIPKQ